jgi:hypothetical protein
MNFIDYTLHFHLLYITNGLRVLRAGQDMFNTQIIQQLTEAAFALPGVKLTPSVS